MQRVELMFGHGLARLRQGHERRELFFPAPHIFMTNRQLSQIRCPQL